MVLKEYLVTGDAFSPHGGVIGEYELPSGKKKTFEVLRALPGEPLKVMIGRRKKRGHQLAKLEKILEKSSIRVDPKCAHFEECGGCFWQHLSYDEQLKVKCKQVEKLFPDSPVEPVIAADQSWGYRNKMEFTFSEDLKGNRFLGLCIPNSRGRVVDLKECHICPESFLDVLNKTRAFWENEGLKAYSPIRSEGMMKSLVVRQSPHTKELLVVLTTALHPFSDDLKKRFCEAMLSLENPPCSIYHLDQTPMKGRVTTQIYTHLHGKESITEHLYFDENSYLKVQVSPASFFQPNTHQAERIYKEAFALLGPLQDKIVYDLYSGIGVFGMYAANFAKHVYCMELNPQAVADAKENIRLNKMHNIEAVEGRVEEKLGEFIKEKGRPDLVIVDPPRIGLGEKTCEFLSSAAPEKILYVSCNPITQVEDVKLLKKHNYRIEAIQPVDQFPHTPHIENILLLTKA